MAQGIFASIDGSERQQDEAFPSQALEVIARLQGALGARRLALLSARDERQARLDSGAEVLGFRDDTRIIRESAWRVASIPADLLCRRVEITGPVDPKMVINALNSGADVFMADVADVAKPGARTTGPARRRGTHPALLRCSDVEGIPAERKDGDFAVSSSGSAPA